MNIKQYNPDGLHRSAVDALTIKIRYAILEHCKVNPDFSAFLSLFGEDDKFCVNISMDPTGMNISLKGGDPSE